MFNALLASPKAMRAFIIEVVWRRVARARRRPLPMWGYFEPQWLRYDNWGDATNGLSQFSGLVLPATE